MECEAFQLVHAFGLHKETWKTYSKLGIVEAAFNLSTREAKAGRSVSSRPASLVYKVPGQPGPHRKTLGRREREEERERKRKRDRQTQTERKRQREPASFSFNLVERLDTISSICFKRTL